MLYIIRHGQTAMNRLQVLQGRSDYPLNEAGVAQARRTAELLRSRGVRFDAVFTSPLVRSVQTARILAPEVAPTVDERLTEMDYGPWEGADLRAPSPELAAFFDDFVHNPAPEGMEPLDEVVARARAFLEDVGGVAGNLLVSTHAIAMKGLLEALTPGARGSWWSKTIVNCEVYAVPREGRGFGTPRPFW